MEYLRQEDDGLQSYPISSHEVPHRLCIHLIAENSIHAFIGDVVGLEYVDDLRARAGEHARVHKVRQNRTEPDAIVAGVLQFR